jgi:hypothetical protein
VQERKKRRIVLASILKPVDDTRMFEKMGDSLANSGQYDVDIIGYPSSIQPSHPSVKLQPLEPFHRLSVSRIFAKWRVFSKAWRMKPDILIFNTHELIAPAIWLKIWRGTRIVYDVRENHYRNILHSGSFPYLIKWPLALAVRFKEKLLAPMIDHFILAEKGYEKEFRFHRGGWTVIQNKALKTSPDSPQKNPLHFSLSPGEGRGEAFTLLFTGTLAASTGVFHAINFCKALHSADAAIKLKIVGYAAQSEVRRRIIDETKDSSFIELVGIDRLVPHHVIMNAIYDADAGIISYPAAQHTMNSHPTKLFEYLSARLPIIVENRWSWIEEYAPCDPFILVDFDKPDARRIVQELQSKVFYQTFPGLVTWETEAQRLLEMLQAL